MSLMALLEVAVAMAFLYLVGSQAVLSIYELWAGYRNVRGKFLYHQLQDALGENTTIKLYTHPPIAALSPKGQTPLTPRVQEDRAWWRTNGWYWFWGKDGLPAYIPANLFAKTLLELAAPTAASAPTLVPPRLPLQVLRQILTSAAPPVEQKTANLLTSLLGTIDAKAEDGLVKYQESVAAWYDAYGERLTGWYKRRVRLWLFLIGLVVAAVANIDTPYIAHYLWTNAAERTRIADLAAQRAQQPADSATVARKLRPARQDAPGYATASANAVNALTADLLRIGFPVGREDTAQLKKVVLPPEDSLRLPADFHALIPRHAEARLQAKDGQLRPGPADQLPPTPGDTRVLVDVPAYYKRYQLRTSTRELGGLPATVRQWAVSVVLATPAGKKPDALARSVDRSPVALAKSRKALLDSLVGHQLAQDSIRKAGPWNQKLHKWFNPPLQQHPWLGWLGTAAALCLGAPFWFDLLCRLVNIRNLGIKPPRATSKD